MRQTGVFIARTQPLHAGHMHILDQAMAECGTVYMFAGSADKLNERNPLPISLRMEILEEQFADEIKSGKLIVTALNDLSNETDHSYSWGTYIFANMIRVSGISKFRVYYSDGWEIITRWFEPYLLRNNISLALTARGAVLDGLCATDMRNFILRGDYHKVADYLPTATLKRLPLIRQFLEIQETMKTKN